MATRDDVWDDLSRFFSERLMELWDTMTIGGQTIEAKYGISRETCSAHRVGFAPADLSLFEYLRDHLSIPAEEVRRNEGYGLIAFPQGYAVNFFRGRLVFPYIEREKILYWSGRETDLSPAGDFFSGHKFLHLNTGKLGLKSRPLYLEPSYSSPTFLVEGHTHALRLRQEGFCGVAIGGAKPNDEHIKQLRRLDDLYWIPDVDVLVPKPEHFTIGKDGQKEFHAARTHADQLAGLLDVLQQLPKCKLVPRYDDDFSSRFPKGDMTDWWKTGTAESFLALLDTALTLNQVEVQSISPDLPPAQQTSRVKAILKRIAWSGPLEIDSVLADLQTHLKLSKTALAEYRRELKTAREQGTPIHEEELTDRASDFVEIYPGQCFCNDVLYYTVPRRVVVRKSKQHEEFKTVEIHPYLINSKGNAFLATEIEMAQRKLFFHPGSAPDPNFRFRWSDGEDTPFGLPRFLSDPQGNTPPSDVLYAAIRNLIIQHLYLDNDPYYDVIAVFCFITYCFQIFDACALLSFNGTKESGKSRAQEIIQCLCYNPIKVSSLSESFLFRCTDVNSPTLLLDEAEQLSTMLGVNNQVSPITLLLNDCYRKGGGVGRVGGENKDQPQHFRIYTPVVIANIKGLNSTLASRSHIIPMKRSPAHISLSEWDSTLVDKCAEPLRNQLYCWALAKASRISEAYHRLNSDLAPMIRSIGFRGREREIWLPFFAVASVMDQDASGQRLEWNPAEGFAAYPALGKSIFGNLLEAQSLLGSFKHEMLLEQDASPVFLAGLRQMVRQRAVPSVAILADNIPSARAEGWYPSSKVYEYLHGLVGLKYFPRQSGTNSLRPVLRHKFAILSEEDVVRHKSATDRNSRYYIRLDLDKIEQACKTYEVPPDAEIEVDEKPDANKAQTEEDV